MWFIEHNVDLNIVDFLKSSKCWERAGWGVTANNKYRVSFWDDENVIKLIAGWLHNSELYTLNQ